MDVNHLHMCHVSLLIEMKEKNKENCWLKCSRASFTHINDDFITQVIQTLHGCFTEFSLGVDVLCPNATLRADF